MIKAKINPNFRKAVISLLEDMGIEKLVIKLNNLLSGEKYLKALNHAINIIEMYETDTKDLKGYLKDGYDIEGFCQGTIYKTAIKDIKKNAGIK